MATEEREREAKREGEGERERERAGKRCSLDEAENGSETKLRLWA